MIPNKYQHIVFAFFMALLMSCLMSLVISVFNVGLVPDIPQYLVTRLVVCFCGGFSCSDAGGSYSA